MPAALFGLAFVPVETAREMELGCGQGVYCSAPEPGREGVMRLIDRGGLGGRLAAAQAFLHLLLANARDRTNRGTGAGIIRLQPTRRKGEVAIRVGKRRPQ